MQTTDAGGTPIDRPVVPLVARLRDEAEHQAGVQRVNDVLARMEKAKAEHDAAMADAAPWRATTGDCL